MPGELIFSATDVGSRRSLMVINEGDSVWSYLSGPGSMTPVADCWLINLVDAPRDLAAYRGSSQVPPATERVTSQSGALVLPSTNEIAAKWSSDGEAVAVLIRARVVAFLLAAEPHGFCRFLTLASPFGNPFHTSQFEATFGR